MLVPLAFLLEPSLPTLTFWNYIGFVHLGLIGGALTYLLWFWGLSRLEPSAAASLGFLSPLVATLLGWALLGQSLPPLQMLGFVAVLASVWLAQRAGLPAPSSTAQRSNAERPFKRPI